MTPLQHVGLRTLQFDAYIRIEHKFTESQTIKINWTKLMSNKIT